ncbi:MAG TPA: ABC transporter permease [Candidatus Acidoferrum sp.]|nr:ABC transporter permease [Candidatus Acidoferrum sp.]
MIEWIAKLFSSRRRFEASMDEELQFHIDRQTAENIASGMPPDEARRQARLQLGTADGVKENCRDERRGHWFDSFVADIRYGLRGLRNNPGFTAVAVFSLALGIGANVAIFTLAQEVLLEKLHVPRPDELRMLNWAAGKGNVIHSTWGQYNKLPNGDSTSSSFAYPVYQQLRKSNTVLGDLFAFKPLSRITSTVNGEPEIVQGQLVSGNYYQELGVVPHLGRPIEPADDATIGAGAVAVISDGYWTRRFGRSPEVIGKTISLNGIPFTIVGVNPRGFTGAHQAQVSPEVFVPFSIQPVAFPRRDGSILNDSKLWWMIVMGRAKPGVSDAEATASLNVALNQAVRDTMTVGKGDVIPRMLLTPGNRGLNFAGSQFSRPVYVLMALAGFVLLLACANLANLLLARASARQREMSVRLALGAGRARIARQIMTESLLLAGLGGASGLFLGYLCRNAIPQLLSNSWEPAPFAPHFGWQLLSFCAGVAILSGLLFGLAPLWRAVNTDVSAGMKEGARATSARHRGFAGKSLVVFQVALSLVLVVCAGLFVRTLLNLAAVNPGFDPKNVLLFDIAPPASRFPAPKDIALHHRIEEAIRTIPGVESVTSTGSALVANDVSITDFDPKDGVKREGIELTAHINDVGQDFFATMHIPILYGRGFRAGDVETAPKVAVVNQTLAKQFFPNQNPIGKTFNDEHIEIVGVCADAQYDSLRQAPPATFYVPYRQMEAAGGMTYEIRTQTNTASILAAVRAAVQSIDRDLPLVDVRTQTEQIDATMQQERIFAALTAGFGVLALILAGVGIYGLMAYNVARRTNEIGVRMALGAQRGVIGRMVLREVCVLVLVGVVIGVPVAWALSRVIASQLFGLSPHDPLTLGGVVVLLFTAGFLAGFVPSRRATNMDPMVALRHE